MSKQPKKRNKSYRGPGAATGPRITHYSVGQENPVSSWWKENKTTAILRLVLGFAALLVSWIAYTLVY